MNKLSVLVRSNTALFEQNTPKMILNMRRTVAEMDAFDDMKMGDLIRQLESKMDIFAALGAMRAYSDVMNAYAEVLERMEDIIG